MHITKINILIFNFFISSTYFDPEGSYSGRRLSVQLWYATFYTHRYRTQCSV